MELHFCFLLSLLFTSSQWLILSTVCLKCTWMYPFGPTSIAAAQLTASLTVPAQTPASCWLHSGLGIFMKNVDQSLLWLRWFLHGVGFDVIGTISCGLWDAPWQLLSTFSVLLFHPLSPPPVLCLPTVIHSWASVFVHSREVPCFSGYA